MAAKITVLSEIIGDYWEKNMRAWLIWSFLVVSLISGVPALCVGAADENSSVPAKGMVTMLDIGKGKFFKILFSLKPSFSAYKYCLGPGIQM